MNDGHLHLSGIPTLRALEVAAAQIDDAAVPDRECENARLTALPAPARVMEDDQPEIALRAHAQLPQFLGQRQAPSVLELGKNQLTGWFSQPPGRAPERAPRGIAGERIVNVDPSPGKVGGLFRRLRQVRLRNGVSGQG